MGASGCSSLTTALLVDDEAFGFEVDIPDKNFDFCFPFFAPMAIPPDFGLLLRVDLADCCAALEKEEEVEEEELDDEVEESPPLEPKPSYEEEEVEGKELRPCFALSLLSACICFAFFFDSLLASSSFDF